MGLRRRFVLLIFPRKQTSLKLDTVVPDGYGLSYSIQDTNIRWTITSLKRDTLKLKHYLAEAATEIREMMDHAAAAEKNAEEGKGKL